MDTESTPDQDRDEVFVTSERPVIRSEAAPREGAPCPMCAKLGRDGKLREVVQGRYNCKTCGFGFEIPTADPVPVLLHDVKEGTEKFAAVLSPPTMEKLQPEQKDLLRDCWANIAWGRNNAGLILLGALIEVALREVVEVHREASMKGGLGDLILYCRDERLLPESYLAFADSFRERVRNLWQHQLVERITTGGKVPGIRIEWKREQGLAGFEKAVKEGADTFKDPSKVELFDTESHRWAQYPRKLRIESVLAPHLYNQTWNWLSFLTSRALLTRHYREHQQRLETSSMKFLRRKDIKGGKRVWEEFKPAPSPPFERRALPTFRPSRGD